MHNRWTNSRFLGGDDFMTELEKQRIFEMREAGKSYGVIAQELGQTLTNIRAYCRRHNLGGIRASSEATRAARRECCENCYKPVKQNPGRKHKRFCSDACRMQWWSNHRDRVKHKTVRTFFCQNCGISFETYGLSHRSYCSTKCYHESRKIIIPS